VTAPVSLPLRLYRSAVAHGARWPLGRPRAAQSREPPRVGYYVWRFPSLTGTYVHREVAALRQAGVAVEVFADIAEDDERLDEEARMLRASTHYVLPTDAGRLRASTRRVLRRDPRGALNAFAYTVLHRYAAYKNPREDVRVFRHALYLAGCALDHGITHLHSPWANLNAFIALLAARMAGIPFSLQVRASADLYRHAAQIGLVDKLDQATFIVTNSALNRAFIERVAPERKPVPIHVVYEGLDPSRFVPAALPRSACDPLRILSVGRLFEHKGFAYLLRALAHVRERGRAVHCTIVGGAGNAGAAPQERQLLNLRRELGLADDVRFAGALPFDHVLREYAQSDVFILPGVVAADGSRDVTPNVLIEAMAMKLAVVATTIGAIPEIVEHRVNGILVPPRNSQALAQALLELADHPSLAETLGRNARRCVEERFDIRQNVQRYVELFAGTA